MSTEKNKQKKFLAYLATLVGGILLLSGIAASLGYFGLPALLGSSLSGEDLLGIQLGEMATIFLGLIGGGLALFHGLGAIANKHSSPLKLPPFYFFYILFALTLGLGSLLLNYPISTEYLFPPLFLLGAALENPEGAHVAVCVRKDGTRGGKPAALRQLPERAGRRVAVCPPVCYLRPLQGDGGRGLSTDAR